MTTMLKFFRKKSLASTADISAVEETGGVPYVLSPTPVKSPSSQSKSSIFSAFKQQFSLSQRHTLFRESESQQTDRKSEFGSYSTGWQLQDSYSGASDNSSSSGRPSISHDTSIDSDCSSSLTPRVRHHDMTSASLSSTGHHDVSLNRTESCSSSIACSPVPAARRKLSHTKSTTSTASSTNGGVNVSIKTATNNVINNSSRRYIRNDNAPVTSKNRLPQIGDPRLHNQSFDSTGRKHSLSSSEGINNTEVLLKGAMSDGQLSHPVPPPRRSRLPHDAQAEKHRTGVVHISSKRSRDSGIFSDNHLPLSKSLPINDEALFNGQANAQTDVTHGFTNGLQFGKQNVRQRNGIQSHTLADSRVEKSYDSTSDVDSDDTEWKRRSFDLTSSFCSTLKPTESPTSSLSSASSSCTAVGADSIELDGNENYLSSSNSDHGFFANEIEGDTGTVVRKGRRVSNEVISTETPEGDNGACIEGSLKAKPLISAPTELVPLIPELKGDVCNDRLVHDDISTINREGKEPEDRGLQLSADAVVNAAVMKSIRDDRHVIVGDEELSPKLTGCDDMRSRLTPDVTLHSVSVSVSHDKISKPSSPADKLKMNHHSGGGEYVIIPQIAADHNFETNGKVDSKSFLNGFRVNGFGNHNRNSSTDSSTADEILPSRRSIVPVSAKSGTTTPSSEFRPVQELKGTRPQIAEKPSSHPTGLLENGLPNGNCADDRGKKPLNGLLIASAMNGKDRTKEITVFHSLNGDASKSVVSVSDGYTAEQIIFRVLEKEQFPQSCHLYGLIAKSLDPRVENDSFVEFDAKDRPLKRQHRSNRGGNIRYELEQKSGVEIKIMCKVGTEKPRRRVFAVPFSATCLDVVHSAIKLFNLIDALPDSFCLFQIDKDTKDSRRVMSTDIVSELGTDSFLLCEKEHLARRDGGDELSTSTPRESPPNMSRSSSGFFPFAQSSQTTIQLQTRLQKVENELIEYRRSSEIKIKNLESNVDQFQAIATCTDPDTRLVAIEKALNKFTSSVRDSEKQVRLIQAHLNVCRKSSQPNVEKWAELSSQLENAQGELLHSSRYHQTVSDWLDDARIPQKLETKTTKLLNEFSYILYDIVEECKPCMVQSVELPMNQSTASRALLAGRDDNGRVVVMYSPREDLLDQGDRILEINDQLVYNLCDEDIESVINNATRDRLKVVVLKESWLQQSSES